jgi:hypothetical protein
MRLTNKIFTHLPNAVGTNHHVPPPEILHSAHGAELVQKERPSNQHDPAEAETCYYLKYDEELVEKEHVEGVLHCTNCSVRQTCK